MGCPWGGQQEGKKRQQPYHTPGDPIGNGVGGLLTFPAVVLYGTMCSAIHGQYVMQDVA